MTATSAPSAAPINALRMWTDGRDIYVEIPSKGECACAVFRFPLHEQGLWRALHLLQSHSYEYAGEPYLASDRDRVIGRPLDPIVAQAGAILKSMGVIKK